MDICSKENRDKILEKFKEIDYKSGLILIDYIINDNYDEDFIKNIIISLSKNKNKNTYEIYEYIIKNTKIDYDTIIIYKINYDILHLKFIHICSLNNNINLLNYLINKGINIDESISRETPLMIVSKYANDESSIDTIKLLLENGANPNSQNIYGNTPLIFSVHYNENKSLIIEIVNLLLKYGANPNLGDNNNEPPLFVASMSSMYTYEIPLMMELIKLLLKKGANIDYQNMGGNTALMEACENSFSADSHDPIKLLIENGSNVNLQNYDGQTALMKICEYANNKLSFETVKILLDNGAEPNLKDNDGRTALMYVFLQEDRSDLNTCSFEIVELLIEHGADPSIKNDDGDDSIDALITSLDLNGPIIEIIKLLLEKKDSKN